jgi:hypothetical protein
MANFIQIRRSNTSVSPANTLTSGELAYSYAANVLYIGAQTGISGTGFKVGGAQYVYLDRASVGNLTANAAVITDGNSFISNTYTSGLVIGATMASPTYVVVNSVSDSNYSNTVLGTLQGNNELVTANAIAHYVQTSILSGGVYANGAPSSGSNGAIQYNDQSTGFNTIAGAPNMIYDNVAGTLKVGNTSSYVLTGFITDLQATQENLGNQNNYVQAMIHNDNTGIEASADWVAYNDDQSYASFIDMGIVSTNYSNAASTITPAGTSYLYTGNSALVIGTANAQYVSIFTGGIMAANERMRFDAYGNVAIGTTDTANATFIVKGSAEFTAGIFANGSIGSSGYVLHSNGTATYWDSPVAGAAGANTQITYNDSGYANGSTSFTFDNSSNTLTVNGTVNTLAISANGSLGSAGQALHSNGTTLYWANVTSIAGTNTQVQFNDDGYANATAGFTFDKTTNALSLGISAANHSIHFADSNTYLSAFNNNVILSTGSSYNGDAGHQNRIAIGQYAGDTNQNSYAIAIGSNTGQIDQRYGAVAIGQFAGYDHQHIDSVAIGANSGAINQLWDSVAIGRSAAELNQGAYSVAMGRSAGANSQMNTAVAIGNYAASNTQGANSIAIGSYAGNESQAQGAVAIGANAGASQQGEHSVAVGKFSGNNNQGSESVAVGYEAGQSNQSSDSVAVGTHSAVESQGSYGVAVGAYAGQIYQGDSAIAVGHSAGRYNQQSNSIAIGLFAGGEGQGPGSISIGDYTSEGSDYVYYNPTFTVGSTSWTIDVSSDGGELDFFVSIYVVNNDKKVYVTGPGVAPGTYIISGSAGTYTVNQPSLDNSSGQILVTFGGQGQNAVAIGTAAADSFQGSNAVAIGYFAGFANQQIGAVSIGATAGYSNQGYNSVAVGIGSGYSNQGYQAISIGDTAGHANQTYQAIAMGFYAGANSQSERAVAIGYYAGANTQGIKAVAVGRSAGEDRQGQDAVAIGHRAGQTTQAVGAIALGRYAGEINQGNNSIAIGYQAGVTNQVNNSIILNASGSTLDASVAGLIIDPIRNVAGSSNGSSNFLFYDTATKEVSYAVMENLSANSTLTVGNSSVNTVINATSITVHNIYSNGTINAASFTINGNLTANSLGIYLGTGTYLNAASVNATSLGVNGDAIITGNLTVQGTLTTIDTTQVAIADINLKLASNNAADVVDFGFYGQYKVDATTYYSGIFRDHTMGDATNAVYHLYSTTTEPGMTAPYVVDGTAAGYHLSTLMSYLDTGKGFVANSTTVALTANASVNVAISANTLHLSSALPANSGGTGLATYLAGDIVYASGTYDGGGQTSTTLTTLSVPIAAANDQILMIKNNIPAYSDTIDGGTF